MINRKKDWRPPWRALSSTLSSRLRWLAGVALLLVIVWLVDVGTAWAYLKQTDWRWVVTALIVVQLQVVLSAVRWQLTANRLGHSITLPHAVNEYYIASFANLSLPGGITGDAARIYRNRHAHGLGTAAHGVLLERVAGQLALLLIAIIGWFLWPVLMQGGVPELGARVLLIILTGSVLLVIVLLLVIKIAPDSVTRFIVGFGPSIHAAWLSDRQWLNQLFLSIGIVATYLLVFYLSSLAVSAPLSIGAVITIVPLVLLSMVIPISIGGWGVREGAAALLWPLAGLSSEAGVVTSVVYALISLTGCVPGLAIFLLRTKR